MNAIKNATIALFTTIALFAGSATAGSRVVTAANPIVIPVRIYDALYKVTESSGVILLKDQVYQNEIEATLTTDGRLLILTFYSKKGGLEILHITKKLEGVSAYSPGCYLGKSCDQTKEHAHQAAYYYMHRMHIAVVGFKKP